MFEEDGLVVLGYPLVDEDVVGVALEGKRGMLVMMYR